MTQNPLPQSPDTPPNDWQNELQAIDAIWIHDGNPKRPHALLTSGRHSNGFVNTGLASCRPALLKKIIDDSVFQKKLPTPGDVDWVIGSAMGAITWSYALAQYLGARAGFTEKAGNAMTLKRFAVAPGDRVLICEDVITTGGSTLKTLAAMADTGCRLEPMIAIIVNRSGLSELGGLSIASLVDITIDSWEATDCPLCQSGSEAVRPKQNWDAMTAQY